MHAWYAVHARTFFLSDFVSVENKGSRIQLPKLKVASSNLVARSNVFINFETNFQLLEEARNVPQKSKQILSVITC